MLKSSRCPYCGWQCLWLLLIVCLLSAGCGNDSQYEALSPGATVLAFGDSVTAGVGAAAGKDYPSQLAAKTGLVVVNAGVSGDTARAAGSRLAPLLAQHEPELVIIELGGNDFLRKTPDSKVKEFLRDMIVEAQESGAQVVLVAVPSLSLLRASLGALVDSDIYAQLSEEEGVILVPDVFSNVLSDSSLRADEIHPNAAGYAQLAQGINAVLVDNGLLR
ncbi:MAG: GDSL-type esterase/lipase family protein [Pseudomonadota bacterium]